MSSRQILLGLIIASIMGWEVSPRLRGDEPASEDPRPALPNVMAPLAPGELEQLMSEVRRENGDARATKEILDRWASMAQAPDAPEAVACQTDREKPPEPAQLALRNRPETPEPPHAALPSPTVCSIEAYDVLARAAAAYRTKLSVIANNLANTETIGFKRSRAELESLSYHYEQMPGAEDAVGRTSVAGISAGLGVRVDAVRADFRQGPFLATGRLLDLTIEGEGFFQVVDSSGEICYTRAGNFTKSANGELVLGSAASSRPLDPAIVIPQDATAIVVSPEGFVAVRQPGGSQLSQVGQIQLARFANPEGLLQRGENLYGETDASGPPTTFAPGGSGAARIRQAALEGSNVDADEELIEWTRTQRLLQTVHRLMGIE